MEQILRRPGADIAFEDHHGERTAVVMVHGAGMDRTTFDDVATTLRDAGHRTITVDLRGHGRSRLERDARFTAVDARDDIRALIIFLSLDMPILVGHSLGGNLMQDLVRTDPTLARGLVVVGATPNHGAVGRGELFALRHLSGPLLRLIPARRLPRALAAASATTASAIARITAVFARMPKAVFLDVWAATASLVAPDPAYRTPVRLALVRGARDSTGNIADAMSVWAEREAAPSWIIPDAGHVAMWDRPGETSRAIRAAVASVDG